MRRSKLECCEEILGALVERPLAMDNIAYEIDIDCTSLRRHVDFLLGNGLVQERISGDETLYAITERGAAVLRTLNFQKYLDKVADRIRMMDEALDVIPAVSERVNKRRNQGEEDSSNP